MSILNGKIIKKEDEKTIKKLDIQTYPWLNFKEENIVFTDNPRKNVILNKYHDPREIKEKVKEAKSFKQLLEKKTVPLYPVDLTADYEKGIRDLIKQKRRQLMGEEEAMALEMSEVESQEINQFKAKPDVHFESKNEQSKNPSHFEQKKEEKEEEKFVPHETKEDIKEDPPLSKDFKSDHAPQAPIKENIPEKPPIVQSTNENPEELSVMVENSDEKVEELKKKGFEIGYRDGFKSGEETSTVAQETKYQSVFEKVTLVIVQLEKLKNELYHESKNVFVEITKLCTEKILREQLKSSDSSLFALFDEVLKTISEKSQLKIELNSQDLIRMKKQIDNLGLSSRVTLIENNEKLNGDFSIESDKGISVVNLGNAVDNIIEKLKSDLFSENESEHKKVS